MLLCFFPHRRGSDADFGAENQSEQSCLRPSAPTRLTEALLEVNKDQEHFGFLATLYSLMMEETRLPPGFSFHTLFIPRAIRQANTVITILGLTSTKSSGSAYTRAPIFLAMEMAYLRKAKHQCAEPITWRERLEP